METEFCMPRARQGEFVRVFPFPCNLSQSLFASCAYANQDSGLRHFFFQLDQGHTWARPTPAWPSSVNWFLYSSHNEFKSSAVNTSANLLLPSWC